jgi:hypothetical protein
MRTADEQNAIRKKGLLENVHICTEKNPQKYPVTSGQKRAFST